MKLAKGTRTMIRNVFVACILLVLSGCANEPIKDIHKGLLKSEVISFMGKPDSSQRSGNYVAFQYANRPIDNSPTERADYYVIFADGVVVEYGYGHVRQGDSSVTNRLFLLPYNKEPPSIPTRN
jgi:hypothetical protein